MRCGGPSTHWNCDPLIDHLASGFMRLTDETGARAKPKNWSGQTMKTRNRTVAVLSAASVYLASVHIARCEGQAEGRSRTQLPSAVAKVSNTNRLGFYEVPLVCPAAPQLG